MLTGSINHLRTGHHLGNIIHPKWEFINGKFPDVADINLVKLDGDGSSML